jgi:phosphate transport system protein
LSFHQELDQIKTDLVRLAALVAETVPRATEVLLAGDLHAARQLIEEDDVIDTLTIDIEERCYQVLALQQPVATDLRAVITAIKLTSEIERSGDLMVNVAKAARRIYGAELDARVRGLIERMGEEAGRLFKLAIDAYAEGNAGLAAALDDMDDHLDNLHKDYIQVVFETQKGPDADVQAAVQLALVGRYYERMGDHAVNISERVQYMVTGWLPEHTGAARLQARAAKAAGADADVAATAERASGNGQGAHPDPMSDAPEAPVDGETG